LAQLTTPRHARHASQLSQDDAEVLAELELIRNLLAAEHANDLVARAAHPWSARIHSQPRGGCGRVERASKESRALNYEC
jgi:hypothetical protein